MPCHAIALCSLVPLCYIVIVIVIFISMPLSLLSMLHISFNFFVFNWAYPSSRWAKGGRVSGAGWQKAECFFLLAAATDDKFSLANKPDNFDGLTGFLLGLTIVDCLFTCFSYRFRYAIIEFNELEIDWDHICVWNEVKEMVCRMQGNWKLKGNYQIPNKFFGWKKNNRVSKESVNYIDELVRVVQISRKYHKDNVIPDKNRLILKSYACCKFSFQIQKRISFCSSIKFWRQLNLKRKS